MTAIPPDPTAGGIARVVVEVEPFHLDRPFDYLVPDDLDDPVQVGSRVEVVFAGRRRRGLVVALADHTDVPPGRLRPLRRVLGPHVWATPADIEVFRWAADRFGAPLADVVRHALPSRTVAVERAAADQGWFPGPAPRPDLDLAAPDGPWGHYGPGGPALATAVATGHGAFVWRPVPGEDVGAAVADLVRRCLAGGRDALVIVPDAGSRAARSFRVALARDVPGEAVVDVRGDLGPRASYRAWLRARCGQARVVIGERGAAFWPLPRLGLGVVLDEANPALKERRSPRHHSREVVLERTRRAGGVGLLVTTVPSAATWRLLRDRRLVPVTASRADERRAAPRVRVDDAREGPRTRLGPHAVPALRRAVAAGRYGVVLAARRGEGRALACSRCGERVRCPRCAASLAAAGRGWACGTCGWEGPARPCRECGATAFVPLAAGAQRLAEELTRTIDAPVAVLEGHDQPAPPPPAVLVMTRGSVMDEPPGPVGAVVLPDLDALARRPAADAPEDALRLAMTLAGWAVGSADVEVVVRTDEPDGAVVAALARWDPGGFWRDEAPRRAEIHFPPAAHAVALHVGGDPTPVVEVLVRLLPFDRVLGPIREADGRHRFLLLPDDRGDLLQELRPWREAWSKDGRDVRVDVDPVDLG
jgi:primosomal protein N' (replication factor Y) (superfamily II helicase)